MAESTKVRRFRKPWQAAVGILLIALAIASAWFLTSQRFVEFVRARVVGRLEDVTGGRVELSAFRWNLSAMEFEADGLTIHGLEKAEEPPFVRVERAFARVTVLSLLRQEFNVRLLSVSRPEIHVIVYPDGTTNQPRPRRTRNGEPVDTFFQYAIGRLEIQQGTLQVNERKLPLDLSASDVSGNLAFDAGANRYDGALHVGMSETKFGDWRPVSLHADTRFALYPDRLAVSALRLVSGRTTLDASGTLSDFRNPRAEGSYKLHLDLTEVSATARVRELRGGGFNVEGSGSWSSAGYASTGKMQWRDVRWSDGTVRIDGASGGSQFSLTPDKLTLPALFASLLGGSVSGSAEVHNWRALDGATGAPEGIARLNVHGVRAGAIASALSSSTVPVDKLHLSGLTDGQVEVTWKGPLRSADARFDLNISPVQQSAEELPVTARTQGIFHVLTSTMDFSTFDLTTPATRVSARGTLNLSHAALQLDVNSTRVEEFRPIIDAIRGTDSPVDLHGSAIFHGILTGHLVQPVVSGHIEARDFTTLLPSRSPQNAPALPSPQLPPAQILRWDSISGEMRFSPELFSLARCTFRRGSAQLLVDGSVGLRKGKTYDDAAVALRAVVRDADIGDLQSLAGYNYPVTGHVGGVLQVNGTLQTMRGTGHISAQNVVAYNEPIRSIESDVAVVGRDLQLRRIRLAGDAGSASGWLGFNLDTAVFRFEAHGEALRLEELRLLRNERVRAKGVLAFDTSGSGTLDAPAFDAKIRLRNIVLNDEAVGDMDAEAVTQGEEMRINAHSNFQGGELSADGTIRLRQDFPAHLRVNFRGVDVDPFVSGFLGQFRLTGHTVLEGHTELEGPLRRPELLNADGELQSFVASVENLAIRNEGPIQFDLQNQTLGIKRLHVVGEGTDFSAAGRIGLAGTRQIDLHADGKVNLRVLQGISPELTSSGLTTVQLTAGGTLDRPQLRGTIEVSNGTVSYVDLPNGLSGIRGTLVFTEDRLQVQQLTARTGGGELEIGGFLTYHRGLSFNFTARGKDIRLRYPPGVSATADADLTLAGTAKSSLLSGLVTITRFGLNPRFDFAQYLAQTKQPSAPINPDSPLTGLRFDVHVVSTPELEVQTSLAKVSGNLDLHLRGSGVRPVVLGRVAIIEGDLIFNSTKYHLERGDVTFTNPVRIEPVLDIEASAHVRDYDITLGFHGPADRLSTTYRSDPPLPTADIIALLALGRTREESAQSQMYNPQTAPGNLTESASNALLGQALNATVSSRVQKLFGVSRIKIDPQVAGPENNANARLTIEQQVSNKITLTYITNLSQSAQQIIQLEYNVSRDVSILAVRDQTGVLGFDVRIRQRKK